MPIQIEQITEPLELGEGPHWHEELQALVFVDIFGKTIHKYEPSTRKHTKTALDARPGFIVPVEGTTDQYVVGLEKKFVVIKWDGEDGTPAQVVRELAEADDPADSINDGKADPRGRLFGGTMGKLSLGSFEMEKASFYRLDGTKLTRLEDKIGISNGLAWDLSARAFYYTDSLEYNIRRYDYDVETGGISNLKYIFDFKKNNIEGFPDGSTIDTNGNLWVAVFGGSCALKIDPRTGKVLQKLEIPAKQVTSATFGGPNLDVLFVTTASITIGEEQKPPGGATFMVTGLGVKGHPNVNVKL